MIKKLLQKLKFEIVLEQVETAASRPSFRYIKLKVCLSKSIKMSNFVDLH